MTPEHKRDLYSRMLRIRRIEEAVADRYPENRMKCPVHLSLGQELVPVAVCAHLTHEDHVYSTHRCHAHYLAKDGDLKAMIAELYGRETGCCKGRGGSMHLVWPETGMMGSSALVGGTIPIAVGSAFAFSRDNSRHVAVAYFGDGATEEGIFYESLNYAQLKSLPVIFVCENNQYATYSHQRVRQAKLNIADRAAGFGVYSKTVDGYDLDASYLAVGAAVQRARSGGGPSFLEFRTYRFRDHVGPAEDISVGYRTQEEVDTWRQRCPITRFLNELSPADRQLLEDRIASEINEAFAYAESSAYPSQNPGAREIYAPA